MSNEICLVVSNCKSCWDTNSKLAFISDSIPDYLDAQLLEATDPIILDGPWETREYRISCQRFVVERVARYRKELSSILNLALGIEYGQKAWGILLDSWLLHFTSVVYDRVNKLENAREQLGDVFLNCFKDDLPPVLTTREFVENYLKDQFNQQLFGDVAKAIGVKVELCVDLLPEDDLLSEGTARESLTRRGISILIPLLRVVFEWWIKCREPVVVLDGYFPLKMTILMFLRSRGKILMIPSKILLKKLPDVKENESLRMLLKVTEEDRFDLVANKLFVKYFPASLLEGLKDYCEKKSGLGKIPVLGTAEGFYYNDVYKILASQVIENGNKIIGFQHGGNYNLQKNELRCSEYFEKLNVDKFYRWKEKSLAGKFLPSQKLAKMSACREARKKRGDFSDILFVSTNNKRFIYRQQDDNSDNFLKKFIAQHKFYLSLNKNIAKHFLLRPYPQDLGWRYKERWLDLTGGEIRFDPNRRFDESLALCRVYVSDHLSTTWLEAFYVGVPVLLFFDISHYFILDDVKSLFEELQVVGILHPTAESAALFLNEKYEAIEEWWEMPKTKEASDKIRDYFFTTSGDFVEEWTQELVALRDGATKGKLNS